MLFIRSGKGISKYNFSLLLGYASRMRRFVRILPVLLIVMLLPSCGSSENPTRIVQGEFMVRFDPIEGGCWNLVASDNAVFFPANLDNDLRVDGLRVSASIRLLPQMATFCPGTPVEVIEIVQLNEIHDSASSPEGLGARRISRHVVLPP